MNLTLPTFRYFLYLTHMSMCIYITVKTLYGRKYKKITRLIRPEGKKNYSNPKAARVQRSWSQPGWVRRLSQGLGRLDCHTVDMLRHAHFHHEKPAWTFR